MRGLFLARIAGMGGKGMIERLAINVLRMIGQMGPYGRGQISVRSIWHGVGSLTANPCDL